MCRYCDVRMSDASGLEMDGKHGMMQILIGDGGYVSIRADKLSIPSVRDTFRFNYCPMCGKLLDETEEDEDVQWIIKNDYDMRMFSDKETAIRLGESMAEEGCIVDLYRVRIESRKTCQMMTVWE